MSGDMRQDQDQERFEDYLELEWYVEELQTGHAAHPPKNLTPTQAAVYRMATLFQSASPEASKPRPAFAAELQARLEQELQQTAKKTYQGDSTPAIHQLKLEQELPQAAKHTPPAALDGKALQKKSSRVSRRSLLGSGAAIAASLLIGAGVEHAIEQASGSKTSPTPATTTSANSTPLVPGSVPSTWHFVTTLADLGENAIRFTADTLVGYVLRDTGIASSYTKSPSSTYGQIIALSAACTHMGCIVKWQDADRKFHCPCHGGVFAENGEGVVLPNYFRYLLPLPRLETKVEDGKVYVRVPVSQQ